MGILKIHLDENFISAPFFIVLASLTGFGQTKTDEKVDFDIKGFKPVPKQDKFIDKTHLLSKTTPDSAYIYWEVVHVSEQTWLKDNRRAIASNGNKNYASVAYKVSSTMAFFEECHPMRSYAKIVGVKDKGEVVLIDDAAKLKSFIGSVDSIDEVMLYALINGYSFDGDTIIGGAYKERENDYLLYLLDYESTPVTYKSVKAILTKSGEFRMLGKRLYKQTDEYIVDSH